MTKRIIIIAAMLAAMGTTVAHAADVGMQARVVSGSYRMTAAQVAAIEPAAIFRQSVEGQRMGAATSLAALHCWGAVEWKKGENLVGLTLWGLWNHTTWCGYGPGTHIKRGSVMGYADMWTGPLWESRNKTWQKWADPIHPLTERHTQASAEFAEGAGGYDVNGETIHVPMVVFASGVER